MKLKEAVTRVRSKNAGPFWVTIDIFCADEPVLLKVMESFPRRRLASLFDRTESDIRLFKVNDLAVLKISFPRDVVQGSRQDRDMHGAQFAHVIAEQEL